MSWDGKEQENIREGLFEDGKKHGEDYE